MKTISQPEPTFLALIRTIGLLQRVLHPTVARFGVSGPQWGVLRTLQRAEQEDGMESLRMTDLSDRLLIRPPSVSGVVDRLQRMGLITRQHAHADARVKPVGLTAKGRRLVEQISPAHDEQIRLVLDGLEPSEQDELRRLLGVFSRHLETLVVEPAEAL